VRIYLGPAHCVRQLVKYELSDTQWPLREMRLRAYRGKKKRTCIICDNGNIQPSRNTSKNGFNFILVFFPDQCCWWISDPTDLRCSSSLTLLLKAIALHSIKGSIHVTLTSGAALRSVMSITGSKKCFIVFINLCMPGLVRRLWDFYTACAL
jgi:hypothetical protein